jgi:hypothetical protein
MPELTAPERLRALQIQKSTTSAKDTDSGLTDVGHGCVAGAATVIIAGYTTRRIPAFRENP